MPLTSIKIITPESPLSKKEIVVATKAATEAVAKHRNITSTPAAKRNKPGVSNNRPTLDLDLSEEIPLDTYDAEFKCLRNSDKLLRDAINEQSNVILAMQEKLDKLMVILNHGQSNNQGDTAAGRMAPQITIAKPPKQYTEQLPDYQQARMAIDVDINQERIDREEKQYNVVLCNVRELSPPTSQSISRTNRNVNDELELVLRLVEDAGGNPQCIREVFRMGKIQSGGRTRPVKVKCSSGHEQLLLLKSVNNLRGRTESLNSYVRRDQTNHQRDVAAAANIALKEARTRWPSLSLVLRGNDCGDLGIYKKSMGGNGNKPKCEYYVDPFDLDAMNMNTTPNDMDVGSDQQN
jgi:hypothetical protein